MNQQVELGHLRPRIAKPVDGWLLVLCSVLTIFSPSYDIHQIYTRIIPRLSTAHNPKNILLLGVGGVLVGLLALLSIAAGLNLWLIRPRAVTLAKRYLLTYLVANIAYFCFWIVLMRPTDSSRLAEMAWYHVVGPSLPFAVWYLYLENSRRVRETYSSERDVG